MDNKKDEELTTFFNFLVFQFHDQIIELLDKVLKGKEKEVTYNFNDTTIVINNKFSKMQEFLVESNNGSYTINTKELYKLILKYKRMRKIEKIKKYCTFIEYMWKNGNNEVVNIVDVTIIEKLSIDGVIWSNFRNFISNEFKEYINTDLISNNIMMKDVKKL